MHAPNQEININNTAAFVEPLCHQLASETTVNAVQATILRHLITLSPSKNGSKFRDFRGHGHFQCLIQIIIASILAMINAPNFRHE